MRDVGAERGCQGHHYREGGADLRVDGERVEEKRRGEDDELIDGLTNPVIFERIAAELPYRAVAPPELSLRQLRRLVYG